MAMQTRRSSRKRSRPEHRPSERLYHPSDIDSTSLIMHRMDLADAPQMYRMFQDKQDERTKVVLTTGSLSHMSSDQIPLWVEDVSGRIYPASTK